MASSGWSRVLNSGLGITASGSELQCFAWGYLSTLYSCSTKHQEVVWLPGCRPGKFLKDLPGQSTDVGLGWEVTHAGTFTGQCRTTCIGKTENTCEEGAGLGRVSKRRTDMCGDSYFSLF